MVDDGLRQAKFSGGGEVFDLVSLLHGAHGRDAAAVLENHCVSRCPLAREEQRGTEKKQPNSIWTRRLPHFSIVIPCRPSHRLAFFPHSPTHHTSSSVVGLKDFP